MTEFASDIRMSASERRQCCEDILEVEEEEFVSVSTLVRGRVKLADVNQVSHLTLINSGHTIPLFERKFL